MALWVGGELFGGFVGAILSIAKNGGGEPDMLFVYGGCLAGAVIGALAAFGIVSLIKPTYPGEYDDYDDRDRDDRDDDRPRRRNRDDRW